MDVCERGTPDEIRCPNHLLMLQHRAIEITVKCLFESLHPLPLVNILLSNSLNDLFLLNEYEKTYLHCH